MRHLNKGCQESRDFVRSKRPMACPNPAFIKQLEVWEKCRFDFQNRSIVDQGPDPDPGNLGCMTEGNLGSTGGGEEVEQEAKCIQKWKRMKRRNTEMGQKQKSRCHTIAKPIRQQSCSAFPKLPQVTVQNDRISTTTQLPTK